MPLRAPLLTSSLRPVLQLTSPSSSASSSYPSIGITRPQPHLSHSHPTPSFRFSSATHKYFDLPNHYLTLSLPPTATPHEIKKSFFRLSKLHHPDLSHDPSAQKFHAINDAYHTLGSPASREKYDREYYTIHAPPSSSSSEFGRPRGSHSSHVARGDGAGGSYAGSRPASGLSRRRTQFRGPPPSFYKNGGYGTHSSKRESHAPDPEAYQHSTSYGDPSSTASFSNGFGSMGGGMSGIGGMGPGQSPSSPDPFSVPHFDHRSHTRTHESLQAASARMRGKRAQEVRREEEALGESSTLGTFLVIGSVITFAVVMVGGVGRNWEEEKGRRRRAA